MRSRRKLAQWSRKGLEQSGLDLSEPEVAAALAALQGKAAIYHCVSRIVNRERVIKRAEREAFVDLMRRYEAFSQVQVLTYCVMSNHFHVLLEVPDGPEDLGASWSDERLCEHLGLIYNDHHLAGIRLELARLRALGDEEAVEEFRNRFFRRMWDLSEFMKILKQTFTQWFNRRHGRRGVLWEERFKSEIVEDGLAARRVASYIDLNPVRAGLVRDPKDWRWCGYGEAVTGKKAALQGLQRSLFEHTACLTNEDRAAQEVADAAQVLREYRMGLFTDGEEHLRDQRKKRRGIERKRVEQVLAQGGRLSEADLLWCRTRYFLDGVVLGGEEFVNQVYVLMREHFGANRKTGARRMRRVETSLCTLRDLQKNALRC